MVWTVGLVALALGAQGAQTEVKTLTMRSLAGTGGDKAVLAEQRQPPKQLHELHAHIGPDGRTVVSCAVSHAHATEVREILRRADAEQD